MYSQVGGSSPSQMRQFFLEMMAALSLVGCCMYWAFQYWGSIDALADFNAARGHCSGHRDFSSSVPSFSMAGSSTISQAGASGFLVW